MTEEGKKILDKIYLQLDGLNYVDATEILDEARRHLRENVFVRVGTATPKFNSFEDIGKAFGFPNRGD